MSATWEDPRGRRREVQPPPFDPAEHDRWQLRFNWLLLVCWILLMVWFGSKIF